MDETMEKWHGTQNGYANRKCRCDPCREAHNAHVRKYSRKKRASKVGPLVHGTLHGYQGWACRCEPCKEASARQVKSLYVLRKQHPRPEVGSPCECCGKPQRNNKPLALDHDHETGQFRGWPCTGCNTAIGKLGDSVDGVRAALEYLVRAAQR